QSRSWQKQPLQVGGITLASNRISIELLGESPQQPLRLAFEEHAGWLMGGVEHAGWLETLSAEQTQILSNALAGLYKLAGVALVREQIRTALPPELTLADVKEKGMVTLVDHQPDKEVIYPLDIERARLKPFLPDGSVATAWPTLNASRVIY